MPKFYVVWSGKTPGIYHTWIECKASVTGTPGAKFKSFKTRIEAEHAYANGPDAPPADRVFPPEIAASPSGFALAVDGACSGSKMVGENRGVLIPSNKEVFRMGPYDNATNNIMEFLAIVKGFRWLKAKGIMMPIYSDSMVAMGWVRETGECKTNRVPPFGSPLHSEILTAHRWLRSAEKAGEIEKYRDLLRKWETDVYGEIPADFGRK